MDFSNLGARTGAAGQDEVAALMKALTAGYGTDMATLTGGAALRVQSLDHTMQAVIQENSDFKLFNKLRKPRAGATVDEWTEQNGVGGFLGGSTNTETGVIPQATGSYARRVGQVKYLMSMRQVSLVQTLQTAIADSQAIEYANGALQLLSDAEYLSFEGNSAVVPTEFDGIYAQLQAGITAGTVDGNHIIDAGGQAFSSITLVNQAVATVRKFQNFGRSTDIFLSPLVQADFDTGLDPTFRVALNDVPGGGTQLGSPVVGIRTSNGNLGMNSDVFVRDDDMQTPFEVQNPAIAATNNYVPVSLTAGSPASNTNSAFAAAHAGNYYYYVAGTTAAGDSVGVKSAQVAISAGQAVALTIARSTAATETGYVIYRSRLNGGQVVTGGADGMSDFRVMARIPVSGSATTVYTDYNRDMPGTCKAYILNLTPGDTALLWRQLLPMMKFDLYPTNAAVIPWAQLLFGYLRISKLKHHVVIKNIVTNGAVFRPFN
jgi:hypothetical protein